MTAARTPLEPDALRLGGNPARWWLATRPAFLTITLGGVLLGMAHAAPAMAQAWPQALLATVLALLAHAAVNVINDVADHHNGTDAANTARVFPFTGGSRFIQNGVLDASQMALLAQALTAAVILGGCVLVWHGGIWLLGIGFIGVSLGWAYSAPPLRLNSRGLGELTVLTCFLLLPQGMQVVLSGRPDGGLVWLSLPFALLTTAILYINQFPDREADALAGKRHWVVRLSLAAAVAGYGLLILLAYACLMVAVALGKLPSACLAALLTAPLSVFALVRLHRDAASPAQLRSALAATIAAANLSPLLLGLGYLVG